MQLRQVLAVVDFSSAAGTHAAWRAAHVAWSQGAELCLLTQVELADGHPSSRFGPTAPVARARADLLHLAGSIWDALAIRPAVIVGIGEEGREIVAACARRADLIVTPGPRRQAQRLVMAHGVPVLLARLPYTRTHRTAIAAHEPGIANLPALLAGAQWLCKPDGVRAISAMDRSWLRTLRASDRAMSSIHALSRIEQERASARLQTELMRAGLRAHQGSVWDHTSAQRLAQEQVRSGASLLVVGQRRHPAWLEFIFPGLAQRLARCDDVDILIVPDRASTVRDARWSLQGLRRNATLNGER